MSIKITNITIPINEEMPDISSFSPEENLMMIKIGSEAIVKGRNFVAGMSQKEIYKKFQDENKEEIRKLEINILVEKEMSKKMEERMSEMYDAQVLQMKKQLELVNQQIKVANQQIQEYESENNGKIEEISEKIREKYNLLLQEKDRQNQQNREVFDEAKNLLTNTQHKSLKAKGNDGEDTFESLSETFRDFAGYKIENKSKQSHKGDFHLFFQDFNILVDVKNYNGNVQSKEVKKIETDLSTNHNVSYAWLVSLNSNICDWNKYPIMNKWITTDSGVKCILYINNLLGHPVPQDILRLVWNITNEFNKLIPNSIPYDDQEKETKERNILLHKQIKILQERTSELRKNVIMSINVVKDLDSDLIEMLSTLSNDIIKKECDRSIFIKKWWEKNIEYLDTDDVILTSTEIWNSFKKCNKEYIEESKIDIDYFKNTITTYIDKSRYAEKSKKGTIEFFGYKFITPTPPKPISFGFPLLKVETQKANIVKKNENQNI